MAKINSSTTPGKMKVILASLAILCLLGVGFVSLTAGNSSGKETAGFALTSTPDALLSGTPTATGGLPNEPDVTLGLVLAGVLLIIVILFGTLHATRGLRTPPHSQ
jgi:hypothetical protein